MSFGHKLQKDISILIIDDGKLAITRMKNLLVEAGFTGHIDGAHDGLQGIEKIKESSQNGHLYDIIFCDIFMPRCSGPEFLKLISEDQTFAGKIPIFVLTTDNEQENFDECLKLGAIDIIMKNYTSKAILIKIKEGWRHFHA